MKMVLIGGFPKPIGGMTTFITRLALTGWVDRVVDIYPSSGKMIPDRYSGDVVMLRGISGLFIYCALIALKLNNDFLHFNFSRVHSIWFFVFCPKLNAKWGLMLHHGELKLPACRFIYRIALKRIDVIFCMNANQERFYAELGVPSTTLVRASSYVPFVQDKVPVEIKREIDSFFGNTRTFVASGYPTALYNHNWCVRFVTEHAEYNLAVFLYGDGAEKESLMHLARHCSRIRLFWDYDQYSFNYALAKAFWYLRPTQKDSFGIAVADAVGFGVNVLASDVCERIPGAHLFSATDYGAFVIALEGTIAGSADIRIQKSNHFPTFSYNDVKFLEKSFK
jgi:hypothetical protein